MTNAICWITDYVVPECWARACVRSDSPALPCNPREEQEAADAA